jgi:3',5'-cyclic AMP phosphodiesterase CpdA
MRRALAASFVVAGSAVGLAWIGCDGTDEPVEPTPPPAGALGAGCLETAPGGLPYQPGCCGYTVAVPEVAEAGFDGPEIGAAPMPDHVHLSLAGPTDTSFAVNWRTDVDTKATQVLYGEDEAAVAAAEGPTETVKRVTGHHMLYGSALDGEERTRVHEVHVCGLEAGTAYFYKVGGPGAWSEVFDAATAPPVGSTDVIRFAVLGDSRNEPTIFAQEQEAIDAHAVDFQLFTGDAVAIGQNQDDWNEFFEATTGAFSVQDGLARTPLMVVNGNHENLAVNYVAQFALPQEVTEGETIQGEEWYSFDYGNIHVVALNDTPEATGVGPSQLGWLEADLAAVDREKTPWVIAMHHRSTYSCGGNHGSDLDLRAAWQPIFDEHEVDFVFSGHDHLYERSVPIRGLDGTDPILADATAGGVPVDGSGTLYVVAGGAGAPLYGADGSCNHTFVTESVRNYIVVEVEDRTVRYTAYRVQGTVLDEFEYTK